MSNETIVVVGDDVFRLDDSDDIEKLQDVLDDLDADRLYRYEQFAEAATQAAGKTNPYKTNYIRQLVSNNESRGPDLKPHVVHNDILDCSFLHEDALNEFGDD